MSMAHMCGIVGEVGSLLDVFGTSTDGLYLEKAVKKAVLDL